MVQPLTKSNEISRTLSRILDDGHVLESSNFQIQKLKQENTNLIKVDARKGYIFGAAIDMVTGDYLSMHAKYENAVKLGTGAEDLMNHCITLNHSGFYSEVPKVLNRTYHDKSVLLLSAEAAFICGHFKMSASLLDEFQTLFNREFAEDEMNFGVTYKFAEMLEKKSIKESSITQVMDLIGEVMREKEVFPIRGPEIKFQPLDDGSEIATYRILVDVSYEEASEMTSTFIDKLFDSPLDLDQVKDAFLFGFSSSHDVKVIE